MRSCLCLVLIIVFAIGAAAATDPPGDRVDRLERELAELRAAVAELRAERTGGQRLAEVERRLAILAEEIENLKVGEQAIVASAATTVAGLAPAASKVYRGASGLSIGGYGEAVLEVFDDTTDAGAASHRTDTFDLLRGILYVGYKYNDRFVFNSEIEFEHGSTDVAGSASVEFAYVDYLARPGLNLRAGLVLLPLGFVNELHEPTTFLGAKRPETEQRIIPTTWRENGLGLYGSAGGFSYRSYVVTGFDAGGFSAGGLRGGRQKGSKAKAEDFAWAGRLDWSDTPGLLVGLGAYVGGAGQGLTGAGGETLDVRTTIWEAHADWRIRGLRLRGLYARADLGDVAELNRTLGFDGAASIGETQEGYYLEAGYDLLAHRPGGRSLVPFVRFEELDTQAEVPAGFSRNGANDRRILTLGLAYQPLEQLILKLDWQDVDNRAGSGVDQVNVAAGYIF